MEQVDALFDRRCRTQTALAKLATLRRRVQRFPALGETLKKLFAPTLEKALTFLDDTLLPSTSNAVERGNRRYRKQIPRSSRRNRLPVEFINRSLLVRHEHLTCALGELMQIGKTPSSTDGVLHHPPEAFDGIEVMAAVSR